MLKPAILYYHSHLKNSIKSNLFPFWLAVFIALPVLAFVLLSIFETELTDLLMQVVPPSRRQGEAYFRDFVDLARVEVVGYGFFAVLAVVLGVCVSKRKLDAVFNLKERSRGIYYMMLVCVVCFGATLWVSQRTLEAFPNSSDEYAYLVQARMFSQGRLWERAYDLPAFFQHNNIPQHEGILVSRFPPGWPLVLSVAFRAGLPPFIVNPVLGVVVLIVFYFFARRFYDESVAVWATAVLAFSGFYVFNAASFFSHMSCLLVTLLFVYNVYLYGERRKIIYGLLAGFFLAFVAVIRYYTAVLIFVPFLVYLLFQYRVKALMLFIWMGLGGIPCIAYLCWYNYAITGNAFMPVTVWAYPNEQLGFVRGHTFFKGVGHVIRWTLMFLYWCSPALLMMYLAFLWRKIKSPSARWIRPEDYAFLMLIVGYFFYYEIGGNQYGPRFLFEALPFLVLLVVSKVVQLREKWAMALLLSGIVYAVVKFPFIAWREEMIVDQRKDLYDLVAAEKVSNAIVFISSPTSPLRPMPAEDLTRNAPGFVNDVIYVVEQPGINSQLMEHYSDRAVYKYVRDVNDPNGMLVRLR